MTTPNMKYGIMTTNTQKGRFSRHDGSNRAKLGRLLCKYTLLLLLMVVGASGAWGQTDYSGVYYIASDGTATITYSYNSSTPTTNFYLVPTCEPAADATNKSDVFHDNTGGQEPFLTTYQIGQNNEAVWVLQQVTDDDGTFYYVIHAMTNKYVVYDPYFSNYENPSKDGTWRRKCMHLQASLNENAKFVIGERDGAYYFIPKVFKDQTPAKTKPYIFWNISDKNQNYRQGRGTDYRGGLVGLFGLDSSTGNLDKNSRWKFETAHLAAPTISDVSASNTITITDANNLPAGYTIRYTTGDGTQDAPTATTGNVYSDPIEVTSSMTVKAVVVRYGIVLTEVTSKAVVPVITAPTVTNNFDGTISLSTTTPNTKIYYTTDGTTPSSSNGTLYSSTFTLGNATVIKAIAYNNGLTESSEVTTYNVPQYDAPTISFNSSTSQVTINPGSGGTAYYNTGDGSQSDPTISSTTYSTPFTISSATTVKAVATHAGYLTSEVATLAITQVATPNIQNNGSNAVSITCATEGATIYYTTDGSTPTTSSTQYTGPLTEGVSGVTIKAIAVKENMITSEVGSGSVTLQCATPVITRSGMSFTISCNMPSDATIYYSLDGSTPTTTYSGAVTFTPNQLPMTVTAVAKRANYTDSGVATFILKNGEGTASDPYLIYSDSDFASFVSDVNAGTTSSACYKLETDISVSGTSAITTAFTGTFDGGMHTISGLGHAIFNTINGGTVKNVILKDVTISGGDNVGAIANEVIGDSRIYNCGVLGTLTETKDEHGTVTNITSTSTISGSGYVGSIVGLLDGTSRVINCYSFATVSGGTMAAGIVGNNNQASTQSNLKTIVVNCMFYGDITGGSSNYPVYGGNSINNDDANNGINPYCYFRKNATFTPTSYNRSWPAEEKYLTRFEYYRSILNSNRKLCTWWVNGANEIAPTDDDVSDIGIAKWVLDPSIAPYPILKPWGKYPSVINQDPAKRVDPSTKAWVNRDDASDHWVEDMAPDTEGQILGTVSVTINGGDHYSGSGSRTKPIPITAMDTENNDFCYGKIQLPYYNDIFGNPEASTNDWDNRYGGNYKEYVVTGWEISGGSTATNYNFADRDSYSGRVYAQGGYFYVPEGVTSITITAHWGKAVYLANRGHSIDRVNVTNATFKKDSPFTPAGTVPTTFQPVSTETAYAVYNDLQKAIKALDGDATNTSNLTVYDQAIVLIGNHQVKNGSPYNSKTEDYTDDTDVSFLLDGKWHPFTIMSADFDIDNEPDYCLQLQFRKDIDRPGIQPIRFDFLPVVELGLAVRHDNNAYAIGIMVPQGHFEITETAFMHTTQFEYDGFKHPTRTKERIETEAKSPVIINGGEHEMFTVRYHDSNRTSYFLLGGNAWIHRFAPGAHPNTQTSPKIYLCPINVIGGEIKELYLSGLYRPELSAPANQGNPYCYIDGGKFDIVAGAGYEKVAGNVTFKIDHSLIEEFYGGGINGSNPIGGNIDITINNSRVDKYCGGPKVGDMTNRTVTTHAKGTTFGVFYGGGNGGNSYYRQLQRDGDMDYTHIETWTGDWRWDKFIPLGKYDDGTEPNASLTNLDAKKHNKGYHAEYEFEVFNHSNGMPKSGIPQITQRGFIKWIQFGITTTGNVDNTLENCEVLGNFYGGGNLASVNGNVTSLIKGTTIIHGNAFGAGYSATIPTFQVHDKANTVFPSINDAGVITEGHISYASTVYEWTNEILEGKDEAYMKAHPTYSKVVNGETKWYCYTWNSLDNLGTVTGDITLTIEGNTEVQNVFGGGESSTVGGSVTVNIKNGTVSTDVYGGGALANTNTDGVAKTTTVNLTGGTINGNVYGGAMGDAETEATVGTVLVKLNGTPTQETVQGETVTVYNDQCVVKGNIFGCNNINGTPLGNVEVHIYKTWATGGTSAWTSPDDLDNIDDTKHKYHLAAVYGGGNLAAYEPTDLTNSKAHVIIDGCDLTSIRQVYGGGNAACVPATQVDVHGTYEIEELFGGGNGKDALPNGDPNPGANVGYRDYSAYENSTDTNTGAATKELREHNYTYGTGQASVNVYGGLIHRVYGGSNTKGNVRVVAVTMLEESGVCEFQVDEAYGGGKSAPMDGEAKLIMSCIPGLKVAYGGAENAEIHNNVTLNITNGTFDRVFGGNNISGIIDGTITVNVQETGCRAVVIGQLYGGGNQAPYTAPFKPNSTTEREPGPTINVNSFTSIGEIYGGGYGATAIVTGDTYVNINAYKGLYASTAYAEKEETISFAEFRRTAEGGFALDGEGNRIIDTKSVTVTLPGHPANKMGAIYNVYGGGNAAKVIGNTHVNIGTAMGEDVYEVVSVTTGTSLAGLGYYTRTGEGTTSSPYQYVDATGTASATATYYQKKTVLGADIRGNVYGGGNEAIVTGATDVNIGVEPTP